MIEQLKTIREFFLLPVPHSPQDTLEYGRAKVRAEIAVAQLKAMVGEPVARFVTDDGVGHVDLMAHQGAPLADGQLLFAAPVAQQPQEIEVQCPVCNHKFYEWPNDKQPQAEAVPAVDRVYEAAKRLVDHADFQLGGVLSAKSKARDIPSNAASKVKARHLASLRDALAKTPQQAEAVPTIYVSRGQLENLKPDPEDETGTYLPVRKTPKGKFTHPLFAAPQQAEAVPQREAFEVEFAKLGYQWSDSNKDKAFLGWSLAVERTPQQAEAVPPTRAEAAAEILQYQLGWTYHDGEWIEDKAATETLRQQAEAVPPGYVLVPVEPTEQMKAAAWAAYDSNHDRVMAAVWKAMIDAAIAQQKGASHE